MSKGDKKGKFSMVSRSIWRSERFAKLQQHQERELYFYFLTNQHITASGCYRLPDGYALADLPADWTKATYAAAKAAVMAAELVDFDPDTDELLIEKWLFNNPPQNQKHATGIRTLIECVESDKLREKLEADFVEAYQPNALDQIGGYGSGRLDRTNFIAGNHR